MTEPQPLDSDAAAALAAFGRETAAPLPPAMKARAFAAAVERVRAPARPLLVAVPVFGVAVLIGAAAFLVLSGSQHQPALAARPAVVIPAGPAPVLLARGPARHAVGAERASFKSGQLEVAAQHAVVLFDVTAAGTAVWVESGSVEVRPAPGAARPLTAGPSLWGPSDAAAALALPAPQGEVEGCTAPRGSLGWRSCLETQAVGTGLVAETALFELSLDAQARRDFTHAERKLRAYQARFAQGVFAPEVSIALMRGLRDAGSTSAARAEALHYLEVFGDEPRAADVRRFLEQLK
jgi:hypothetical protein